MAFSLPNGAFRLTPQEMGAVDVGDALKKGIELGYLPREKNAALQSVLAKNIEQAIINKNKQQDFDTTFASRNASTRSTNLGNQEKQFELKNPVFKYGSALQKDIALSYLDKKYGPAAVQAHKAITEAYPDAPLDQTVAMVSQVMEPKTQQQMPNMMERNVANSLMQQPSSVNAQQVPDATELSRSVSSYMQPEQQEQQPQSAPTQQEMMERAINAEIANKQNRGVGASTTAKDQALLFNNMKKDNPSFTDEEAFEAINKVDQGEDKLDNGKPINVSYLTRQSKSKVDTQGHPAAVTAGIQQANQSEAEIDSLVNSAKKAMGKYGTTYAGYSPTQISDSFKSDENSQKELGRFIAGQQLQYEITQNEIRIAQGKPGVKTTQDLMDLGQQRIKTLYPKLSATARKEAQDYFVESLKKGLSARNKVYKNNSSNKSSGSENDPFGLR